MSGHLKELKWGDIESSESSECSDYEESVDEIDEDEWKRLVSDHKLNWRHFKDLSPYNKDFEELINKISNKPKLYDILSKSKDSYLQLMESRREEKSVEPAEPDFYYISRINHFVEWDYASRGNTYIDKPFIISKINSPYRNIPGEYIDILINKNIYPEKSTIKNKIDIYNLRDFFSEFVHKDSKISSSQQDVFDIYSIFKSYKKESISSEVLLQFSDKLELSEKMLFEKKLMDKPVESLKRINEKIEYSSDTLNGFWILNLLETINLKIKMSYNTISSNFVKEQKLSVNFHEGRRINTFSKRDGSSTTKIEIIEDGIIDVYYLFLSQSFSVFVTPAKTYIGNADMINYLMTISDHSATLKFIRDFAIHSNLLNESLFINYILSLSEMKSRERMGLAGMYESTCLLMADFKSTSSKLPLIDNLLDSIEFSIEKTEELVSICESSSQEMSIKMSCLGKTIIYAELDETKGLKKYTQRTNRDHPVDKKTVEDLRSLFRMKVVTNYVKKYGMIPRLYDASELLLQELSLMASRGNFSKNIVSNCTNYKRLRLGKMVEMGQEMNITSRIIDKACTKDKYDPSGNSIKELIYYIEHNDLTKIIEEIELTETIPKLDREIKILDRKEPKLNELKNGLIVRLVEKEKELKPAARFFGVGSFKLKIYISTIMELVKRAMKLIPGQMMTMTEDERRSIMYKMSTLLSNKNSYSIFLDYSGHNTSQRPENNLFIMEEIADMYGFEEGSNSRKHFIQVLYVFENIDTIYENPYSDMIYLSQNQRGAIEGWLGPLWGIQSQLMMEDMFKNLGFKEYIATTYSDDSCGVFVEKELNETKLDDIISRIQLYALKMGLLVKLSQTQVTNGRCSMLKNHYLNGKAIENNYKRMMGISPNSSVIWGDELEMVKNIDSGYTSAASRSRNHRIQTLLRNYRVVSLIKKEIMRFAYYLDIDFDHRFYLNSFAESYLAKMYYKKKQFNDIISMPSEENIEEEFFKFNLNNKELMKSTLMLMYMPYAMFGYSCTPIPDAILSGFSISNIKRISYVESLLENGLLVSHLYSFIRMAENASSYLINPYPINGGRFDTSTILKDVLKRELPSRIKNEDLLDIHKKINELDRELFEAELVTCFKENFSSRIVGKFSECSIFNYFEEIYSKIDNSTTFTYIIGKRKISELWNKAWTRNHKLEYKIQNNFEEIELNYDGLISAREQVKKYYKLRGEKKEIEIKFMKIEEIPLLGKISVDICGLITPVKQGERRSQKLRPPTKTNVNKTKFDRDLEIEGMFQNKLIFMSYELVRYVKWMIMDMEKYSTCGPKTKESLYKIADLTLSTFTDAKFEDISEHVVAPKGGRYFHRAVSSGFNPKTGDLSSNEETQRYEITGLTRLIEMTGGVDNNLNLQYLIMSLKAQLGYINPSAENLKTLNLQPDISKYCRDVSFTLENLKPKEMIQDFYSYLPVTHLREIRSKSKLYKSFSYFVSNDEEIMGKFINHAVAIPNEILMRQNSFRSVHKYMEDQGILSPEVIPDDTLIKLAPELRDYSNRHSYFDEFYKFYKGLNIIDNETPTRSVIRSLLYNELFRPNKFGSNWTRDICEKGYSKDYRSVLLKLFLISTSLVYKLGEVKLGEYEILINKELTIINGIKNLRRMKENKSHFHIKDKRITELLLMAFPTSGYLMSEVAEEVENIYYDYNKKQFQQFQLNSYYNEDIKNYIDFSEEEKFRHPVDIDYEIISVNPIEFIDNKRFNAALRGFEMICSMNCKPRNVSSPTMSDIFPSIFSLLSRLKLSNFIRENDIVCDLFAGRGDSHLAMNYLEIRHISVSRNDGYNLINRIRGMKEIKNTVDMTERENYVSFVNSDVFLLDISHFDGKGKNLKNMIIELTEFNKKLIIRMNSITKYLDKELLDALGLGNIELCIPSIESPGYIYLTYQPSFGNKNIRGSNNNKFTDSIVLEKFISSITSMTKNSLFDNDMSDVKEHTEELISDDKLVEMMLTNDPEFVEIPCLIEDEIQTKGDLDSIMFTSIPNINEPDDEIFLSNLIEKEKIEIYNPRLLIASDAYIINHKRLFLEAKSMNFPKELVVSEYVASIGEKGFITSFSNMSENELFRLTSLIVSSKFSNPNSIILWKFIMKIGGSKEDKLYSHEIIENINISKLKPDQSRTIDKLFTVAHIAVKCYKSKRILEGLMLMSGMKKPNLNELMRNKSKNKRYDCLNYKLLIGRITRLHKKYDLLIKTQHLNINELLKLKEKGRVINKREEAEMINFINSFHTVEEFFENQKSNELFDAFIDSLKNEMMIDPANTLINTEEDSVSGFIESFIDTSTDIYEKNANMSYEELENALAEMSSDEIDDFEEEG